MKKFINLLITQNDFGVVRIVLNDPKTYNSLSLDMINSLSEVLKILNTDKKTKVIVIEGSGKGFSAGHNLNEIINMKNKYFYKKLFSKCSNLMMSIIAHEKPIIAKVHGAAFAAGCQLVASCDLAYSDDKSIFATPGVNIGLFCSTPMVALTRKVNRKKSMEMLLTGNHISAKEAKDIGLINNYYKSSNLENEIKIIANKIASKSNLVLKIGKNAYYKQLEMPLDKAYIFASKVMTENLMKEDAKEGIESFIKKRKPIWKNR